MSQTVSIRLDEDVFTNLDKLSQITDRSKSWLMGHAVKQYVEHESWQVEAIQKTLAKVEKGPAKFANHEQVSEWMNSWGSANEKKRPSCR